MPEERTLLHTATLRWLDDLSTQGIFTTDTNLIIRSWNRWLERQSGKTSEEVVGRLLFEAFPELISRGVDKHYRAALGGQVGVLAYSFHRYLLRISPHGDGDAVDPFPQSSRIAPLVNDGRIIGTITVIDDVSDRVRSEMELRRQVTAAENARRAAEEALRLKDDFLTTLSHEMRTPLNAVVGWTRILLARPADAATLQHALEVIDRNATAQTRLIEDMLDMARILTGKLRLEFAPVDLGQLTRSAIDVVAPAAQARGVSIHHSVPEAPAVIIADGDRIQQIAWNLLSNAVKFTPPGGRIDVTIASDSNQVWLRVQDSGQGIAREFLPHVFERFRQQDASTSRREGGLGLGLSLVRQLVELHGGDVTAESAGSNRGSTFTVRFPVPKQGEQRVGTRGASLKGRPLDGIDLLVVDDDADWRDLLTVGLGSYGAVVTVAATVGEALGHIDAAPGLPAVIVADIGLPGEDGYALVNLLQGRDDLSAIPVIAVTAYAGPDNERRALAAGFRRHCAKPLLVEDVATAILATLSGDRLA